MTVMTSLFSLSSSPSPFSSPSSSSSPPSSSSGVGFGFISELLVSVFLGPTASSLLSLYFRPRRPLSSPPPLVAPLSSSISLSERVEERSEVDAALSLAVPKDANNDSRAFVEKQQTEREGDENLTTTRKLVFENDDITTTLCADDGGDNEGEEDGEGEVLLPTCGEGDEVSAVDKPQDEFGGQDELGAQTENEKKEKHEDEEDEKAEKVKEVETDADSLVTTIGFGVASIPFTANESALDNISVMDNESNAEDGQVAESETVSDIVPLLLTRAVDDTKLPNGNAEVNAGLAAVVNDAPVSFSSASSSPSSSLASSAAALALDHRILIVEALALLSCLILVLAPSHAQLTSAALLSVVVVVLAATSGNQILHRVTDMLFYHTIRREEQFKLASLVDSSDALLLSKSDVRGRRNEATLETGSKQPKH